MKHQQKKQQHSAQAAATASLTANGTAAAQAAFHEPAQAQKNEVPSHDNGQSATVAESTERQQKVSPDGLWDWPTMTDRSPGESESVHDKSPGQIGDEILAYDTTPDQAAKREPAHGLSPGQAGNHAPLHEPSPGHGIGDSSVLMSDDQKKGEELLALSGRQV